MKNIIFTPEVQFWKEVFPDLEIIEITGKKTEILTTTKKNEIISMLKGLDLSFQIHYISYDLFSKDRNFYNIIVLESIDLKEYEGKSIFYKYPKVIEIQTKLMIIKGDFLI
jgi:hypothetical protein